MLLQGPSRACEHRVPAALLHQLSRGTSRLRHGIPLLRVGSCASRLTLLAGDAVHWWARPKPPVCLRRPCQQQIWTASSRQPLPAVLLSLCGLHAEQTAPEDSAMQPARDEAETVLGCWQIPECAHLQHGTAGPVTVSDVVQAGGMRLTDPLLSQMRKQ